MPLCRVDVIGEDFAAPKRVEDALRDALACTCPKAPVVVLIHGYKFSPSFGTTSPHTHILSLEPDRDCWKAVSWPRELGLGSGRADEPLCIALGWEARGSLWQAYDAAEQTGSALARLINLIRDLRPGRDVDVLAHSLGCRVTLAALPHLPAHAMGRAVLMAPAEMRSCALDRLNCPAGRTVQILNITSPENGFYDRLLEWMIAPLRLGDWAIGSGLSHAASNWSDVNIDCPETRHLLADLGYPIAASEKRVCHWSVYLRPGLFPFYRAVLDRQVPLSALHPRETAAQGRLLLRLVQNARRPLPIGTRQAS